MTRVAASAASCSAIPESVQALEDGIVLAEELDSHSEVEDDAFAAYAGRRHYRCKLIVDTSVAIGRWEMDHSIEFDHQAETQKVIEEMVKPL